jgi:uncharacterized membrane protein HdeD (DUF308 family)
MNSLFKYLGVIALLAGVVVLAVPALIGGMSNAILLLGLGLIVAGYLTYIVLNKKVQ